MISREIMGKNVTIRDIAEAAMVSHMAVVRVLNGRPATVRVSAATRERILAIVRQSGYRTNRIASDMARGRQTTLGRVMAPGGPDASASHLAAIEAVLASAGYRLLLIVLPTDPVAARDRVTALLHDGVAGILCAPGAMAIAAQVAAGSCPVIAMGQGAGEMILKALGVEVELRVESSASKVVGRETPLVAVPTPIPSIPPVVVAVPNGNDRVLTNLDVEPGVSVAPALERDAAVPEAVTPIIESEPPPTVITPELPVTAPTPTVPPPAMEGTAAPLSPVEGPSAPAISPTIPEPVPVDPAPGPAFEDTAVTEPRPPLNSEAAPQEAPTTPAATEPVSPPPMEGAAAPLSPVEGPSAPVISPTIPVPVPVEPAIPIQVSEPEPSVSSPALVPVLESESAIPETATPMAELESLPTPALALKPVATPEPFIPASEQTTP